MRLHLLRHGFTSPDSFLMLFLVTLGFVSLNRLKSKQEANELKALYSMIPLCGRGIYEQGQSFYVAQSMLHLIRGQMNPDMLDVLGSYVPGQRDFDQSQRMAASLNRSDLPVPTTKVSEDLKSARLEHMIKEVEDISLSKDDNNSSYAKRKSRS